MKEIDLYKIKRKNNYKLNYLFDKATSMFSKKDYPPIKNVKKILFLRNDHIGDMVYVTPVFKEIKRAFPKAKITVMATKHNKALIEKNKNVDSIIEMDLFWRRFGPKALVDYWKVFKKIKKKNFDVGVDLRRSKLNMFFFLFLPMIKNRVSYYNVNGGRVFLTHPVLYEKKRQVTKEHLNLIDNVFNFKVKYSDPEIFTDKQDEKEVNEFLKKNNLRDYILLFPGATVEEKRWKKFDVLIDRFQKKYKNIKIVVVGANSEKKLVDSLCKNRAYCLSLLGFGLRKMVILIKKSKVLVANAGAGTDIGWVVGGNLVALADGISDLKVFMPLKKSKVIQAELPYFPYPEAIDLITPKEVMNAIDEFMKSK